MPFLSRPDWDDYSYHGSHASPALPPKRKEKGLMSSLKKFLLRQQRGDSASTLRGSPSTFRNMGNKSSNSVAAGRTDGKADGLVFALPCKAPPRSSASMPSLFPQAGPLSSSSSSLLPIPRELGAGRRVLPAPSSSALMQFPSIEACTPPFSSGPISDPPANFSMPETPEEAHSQGSGGFKTSAFGSEPAQPDPEQPQRSSASQPLPFIRPPRTPASPVTVSTTPDTPLIQAVPPPPTMPPAPSPTAQPAITSPAAARSASTTLLAVGAGTPDVMRRSVWSLMDYSIGARMYKGDVSSVYKAMCLHSNIKVVLKVYHLGRVADNALHTLVREVRIHTELSHANILLMYGVFEEDDRLVLVLERAARGDLFHLHRSLPQCRMSEDQVRVLVLAPLLDALVYLHSRGVCHRDIKPENLLMTSSWQLRLADFGAAINIAQERAVTRTGTVDYMAPEVQRCPLKAAPEDNKDNPDLAYTTAADVWSVGVLAYELMVGFPPFITCGTDGGEGQAAEPGPHRPRERDLSLPHFLSAGAQDFIATALAERPGDRPTAAQLLRHPWLKHAVRQYHARQEQEQGHSGRLAVAGAQRQLSQLRLSQVEVGSPRQAPPPSVSRPREAVAVPPPARQQDRV